MNPIGWAFRAVAAALSRYGVIDRRRGERIAALTWPRFLTMFARHSQRVADVAMVGLSVGPAAIAGLAFATIYWRLSGAIVFGLIGGTISQVAQRYGAGRFDSLDMAVKQSVWVGIAIVAPFVVIYWVAAEPLVGLVSRDPAVIGYGSEYLRILGVGLVFSALNLISSRTLAGADDTVIAMSVRATGAVVNIVLNAVFIFGLGMGVAGAALGTVLAEALTTLFFLVGFTTGGLPVVGRFPVRLSPRPPYLDLEVTSELLALTRPLMVLHVGRAFAQFPLFALLALFGPTVVAAFEVARRVRSLLGAFGSGFSTAASSLVGQELGRGDEPEAGDYSRDLVRFSAVVYVLASALVILLAEPIARAFVDEPAVLAQTVPFVRVAAVSLLGLGMTRSFEGVLKAAGDNRWSLYGRFFGLFVALLPLTFIGAVTPIGIVAVYVALVAETWSTAAILGHRVFSGRWKRISRTYRPDASVD